MSKTGLRAMGVLLAMSLVMAACGSSSDDGDSAGGSGGGGGKAAQAVKVDYDAVGLWDDGPCDTAKPPLKIGTMTVFESPVLSQKDQVTALEASATAFNKRGGANGSCIKIVACDDGANADQAVGCVRTIDDAGVVATVNDLTTAGAAEVNSAMSKAGIPQVANNVTPDNWGDPNVYPIEAGGTGITFMLPQGLVEQDVKEIGILRVDQAAASAMSGLLEGIYGDQGVTFPVDVPVTAGTTDYSQFILAAQNKDVGGVILAVGEQEAVQLVKAGQQLGTKMLFGSSLGSFPHAAVKDLGEFSGQMVFATSYPPATIDLPVYKAMRADLAASGDKALQPASLRVSSVHSWVGMYGLLWMLRNAKMTDFSREGVTKMLKESPEVPMLGIFGDENWQPNEDHPGLFKRAGTNHWGFYKWDADAPAPDGLKGNFVESGDANFDELLCGSPLGAPEPC